VGSSSHANTLNYDNRLGLTDDAIGVSSSGANSKTSFGGHIIDLSTTTWGTNSKGGTSVIGGSGASGPGGVGNGGGIDIDILDGGAIQQAFEFAGNAIDAVAGEGFQNLLSTMTSQQDTALAQLEAIRTATNDKEGVIDQKTLLIGGAIALAFVFFMSRRK
jgi:hypothetical protein